MVINRIPHTVCSVSNLVFKFQVSTIKNINRIEINLNILTILSIFAVKLKMSYY